MGPADVQAFTRADPFRPFRVRTTDGTNYEVHYPHMSMPLRGYLVIGIPDPESQGRWAEDAVELTWDRVTAVELLAPEGAVA
jgi:hypothetical protein